LAFGLAGMATWPRQTTARRGRSGDRWLALRHVSRLNAGHRATLKRPKGVYADAEGRSETKVLRCWS
jgi:hypothetical protein